MIGGWEATLIKNKGRAKHATQNEIWRQYENQSIFNFFCTEVVLKDKVSGPWFEMVFQKPGEIQQGFETQYTNTGADNPL